jgi:tRNA nucleotidyltransferase (CCA-adding enzyme)
MSRSLTAPLAAALSAAHLDVFRRIANIAGEQALPLYVVGGFVRDLLLGHPSTDFDFVVEGDAIKFAREVAHQLGGTLTPHDKFRTATWTPPSNIILSSHQLPDFVSARRETYAQPAALPDVTLSALNDDIHRRDFTINTLAIRLDGTYFGDLIDLLNGEQDLKAGVIRVLHDQSFIDDPTRIFRAARYEQRFGFAIEPATLNLITPALPHMDALSGDRIRHEIELFFTEADPNKGFVRLAQLGVLNQIHPDFMLRSPAVKISNFPILLSQLHASVVEVIVQRLNLSSKEARLVLLTRGARDLIELFKWDEKTRLVPLSELHKALSDFPIQAIELAQSLINNLHAKRPVSSYISRRATLHLTSTGDTIKALGLPPGPKYKDILFRLECACLDGEVSTADGEQVLLERLVEEAKTDQNRS